MNSFTECEHTEDDNDLDFRCEDDLCPVKLMTQREVEHFLASAHNSRVSQLS